MMIVGTIQQEVKSILSLFYFVHHLHSSPEGSQSLGVLYQRIETEVIGSCYERSLMPEVLASKLWEQIMTCIAERRIFPTSILSSDSCYDKWRTRELIA
jgi:hypothetical protein